MLFSSNIFLFTFLPIALAGYYALPRVARNLWIFLISLLFYGWGSGAIALLLVACAASIWLIGLLIERAKTRGWKLALLWGGSLLNLAALIYFKYSNFFYLELGRLMTWAGADALPSRESVILPIGISFFSFQAISYLVETYRAKEPALRNPINVGMYLAFFPQLIAGPIVRHSDIHREILKRRENIDQFFHGVWRFALGLGKKTLLADTLGAIADKVFGLPQNELSASVAWIGAVCYTFQIYYDFSGYSDMAIGLGRMFGFEFPENFVQPYRATSIRDFWRRWHLTLSTWFRDFVYIPLGGDRKGLGRTMFNLLVVFTLTGLWHGAAWTFVIWGWWHGAFIMLDRFLARRGGRSAPAPWKTAAGWVFTTWIVIVGWVIFRAENWPTAWHFLSIMFGLQSRPDEVFQFFGPLYYLQPNVWVALVAATLFAVVPFEKLRLNPDSLGVTAARAAGSLALLLLCFAYLSKASFTPFIYFRF